MAGQARKTPISKSQSNFLFFRPANAQARFALSVALVPLALCLAATADTLETSSSPTISVSDSGDPSAPIEANFTFGYSLACFNSGLGILNSVTIHAIGIIPVYVNGQSIATPPNGGYVSANVAGEASAVVSYDGQVFTSASGGTCSEGCSASGEGVRCSFGDGSSPDSAAAATLQFDTTLVLTDDFAPVVCPSAVPMSVAVDLLAFANADVANGSVWVRTHGTPNAFTSVTLTYDYTPGSADNDGEGVINSQDNCDSVAGGSPSRSP